jgi:hypothetical protein
MLIRVNSHRHGVRFPAALSEASLEFGYLMGSDFSMVFSTPPVGLASLFAVDLKKPWMIILLQRMPDDLLVGNRDENRRQGQ